MNDQLKFRCRCYCCHMQRLALLGFEPGGYRPTASSFTVDVHSIWNAGKPCLTFSMTCFLLFSLNSYKHVQYLWRNLPDLLTVVHSAPWPLCSKLYLLLLSRLCKFRNTHLTTELQRTHAPPEV